MTDKYFYYACGIILLFSIILALIGFKYCTFQGCENITGFCICR
jgi:hypothetical protein